MTYHHGWLSLVDPVTGVVYEVINQARTAAYLRASEELGCARVSNVIDDGGCAAYAFEGACTLGELSWDPITFTSPATDNAPWYNSNYPQSADALGIWISEWTGLDAAHVQRGVQAVGALRGGGQMGRLGSNHREMAINAVLFGTSEKALEYLFDWLQSTLASVCSTCALSKMLVRRWCDDDPAEGIGELREVGLLSGLQWIEPLTERSGCYARPVSFTLAAGDPCIYGPEEGVGAAAAAGSVADCLTLSNLGIGRPTCRPTCSELNEISTCRRRFDFSVGSVGASAPYIILENSGNDYSTIPVSLRLVADLNAMAGIDPCALPLLGQIYVAALPPNSTLVWDVVGRQVLYRDAGTGNYINGWSYVEASNVGVPRFPALGCGDFSVLVEPGSLCLYESGSDWFDQYDNEFGPDPAYPDTTVYIQERVRCS